MGYSDDDFNAVPECANLGLGCGAPLQAAAVRTVLVAMEVGTGNMAATQKNGSQTIKILRGNCSCKHEYSPISCERRMKVKKRR